MRRVILLAAVMLFGGIPGAGQAESMTSAPFPEMLQLQAKDPDSWQVVESEARGALYFDRKSGAFVMEARGLRAGASYALVNYFNHPPKAFVMARGLAQGDGALALRGTWHRWRDKIWLVSGKDISGESGDDGTSGLDQFRAWHPGRYLFEERSL